MNLVSRSFAREAFAEALSADALVRAMLDFERALAGAEADAGVIPQDAARAIAAACSELRLSPDTLASDGKKSGSLAVPLVKALTDQVARADARAAAFVHYGSTSQDVLDTALVLCLKPCLADAGRVLATAVSHLAGHARRHAGVGMLGRTLMQPATPITAGLKIARWAAALHRCRLRLSEAGAQRCVSSSAEPSAPWTPSARSARSCAAAWPSAWAWARRARGTTTATTCCA
jgi:3-carboxy-cis,cis-muconate cycloisomerase